jgi:serine protease Do
MKTEAPRLRSAAAAALVLLFAGACTGVDDVRIGPAQATAAVPAASESARQAAVPDFTWIVERYGPAVVNISTVRTERTSADPRRTPGDPFSEFFRRFGIPFPPEGPSQGLGSGFIVSEDGYILTNAHVVEGASEVHVKLTDRREFKAKVVGADRRSDVALLKVEARGLPTVKFGDPAQLKVGEWVLAIGSPFGFENSVTSGIVSAKSRALPDDRFVPFIQTDVAVNPGNSGGPLFNLRGEVVGINSQIYSRTGGYMGLSFAIPIDVALEVKEQLQAHGKVTRGRIGVTIQEVTHDLARSFGLAKPEGALVSSVEKGGPADRAGVEPGDVILKLNGNPVASSTQLPVAVARLKPGSEAKLEVWRNGATRTLTVKVGELEEPGAAPTALAAKGGEGRLGLTVRPLTPEEKREAQVESGVMVEAVSGPAARAGIRPGDVILALNGNPVRDAAQLRRMLEKSGKVVALLVQRGSDRIYIPVTVG